MEVNCVRMGDLTVTLVTFLLTVLRTTSSQIPPSDCTLDSANHLTCHLSSINSRLERTDFSVIPNTTTSLKVICSQTNVGTLHRAIFTSLPLLEKLSIEGCIFNQIPAETFEGLIALKHLSIRSYTNTPLNIEFGAFSHLAGLEALDLSQNAVRKIPNGELCKLEKLKSFNMSRNEIGSGLDLGLNPLEHPTCLNDLTVLDMTHNQLTTMEESTLMSWPSIEQLRLDNNYIRFVGENMFSNLSQLHHLHLSNNQISHLPTTLLGFLSLRELHLANNSLSSLPSGLFRGQQGLEVLDLSGNILMSSANSLPHNLTQHLPNLLELNICANQLVDLSPQITAPLFNLQVLKICDNQLREVNLSSNMINLVNIDISDNQLGQIGAQDFDAFTMLTHLSLASNEISAIHPAAFKNNSELLVLDLSANNLFHLPASLKHLGHLQTLDLSNNFISDIEQSSLDSLSSLWRLQMSGNLMLNISNTLFSGLKSLQILDMSSNKISEVQSGAFDQTMGLRAVRLDGNDIAALDGLFSKVPELIWLNVSDNKIQHFDYALVPRSLSWLDISHNQISVLHNYFDIKESDITYLDASFNKLVRIEANSFPAKVETVLLNDNKIALVAPYTFFQHTKLVKVDLSVNEISSFSENAIRLSTEVDQAPIFHLGGNPISCNCQMQWFKSVNEQNQLKRYPFISDLESIYCQLMNTPTKTFIPLVEARNDQFLCSYRTHCFSLCQCCQFDSCDCEMICPEGCDCYHDNSWSKNIIQCSNNNYQALPTGMPMDATEIHLDGNDLKVLKSHSLIGRKNLRVLHLNNSNIEKIENKTFNGLKTLRELHLENNRMTALRGFEFSGLSHLRELYLQGNVIRSIHNATFKALKSLEILSLEGNLVIDFPIWQLALNPYLVSIKVADNLWSCECEFINKFKSWMGLFRSRIMDADQIGCVSNEAVGSNQISQRLIDYEQEICDPAVQAIAKTSTQVQEEQRLANYVPLIVSVLASFSMLVIFGFVLFSFRHSIRIWFQSKKEGDLPRVLDSSLGDSAKSSVYSGSESERGVTPAAAHDLFDCFLSYSPLDAMFVHQILGKELEASCGQRVCLHHRDLPQQEDSNTNILLASKVAEASRKTIVVLSPNYLNTELVDGGGLFAAITQNKPVLFVVLGSPPETMLMHPSLRRVMTLPGMVLQWGQDQFWAQLQFCLGALATHETENYYSTCKFPGQYAENYQHMISHI